MSDQDKGLVAKGTVKREVIKKIDELPEFKGAFFTKGSLAEAIEDAIDALKPVAESKRSEAEIRAATERLRTHTIPYDPTSVAVVLEYASGIDKNPELWVRELFAPSGSNQDTSRNEVREKGKGELDEKTD